MFSVDSTPVPEQDMFEGNKLKKEWDNLEGVFSLDSPPLFNVAVWVSANVLIMVHVEFGSPM